MGLFILSKQVDDPEFTIRDVMLAAYNAGLKIIVEERKDKELLRDVYIYKDRVVEEYIYFGFKPKLEIIREYDIHEVKYNDFQFYLLVGTDQAEYDHLIYDFSLAYLRINPAHVISLYGDTFFTLEDMERMESKGGYYKDWCYTQ